VYAQSPSSARDPPRGTTPSRALCANCGTVASTTLHEDRRDDTAWEVRVRFDDGTRRVLRFPTDPGFRVGDRVFLSNGRLLRG
jgi:hypothetical protein